MAKTKADAPNPDTKVVNLALQGGGSHGAFSWGVLDRLLDEEGFLFEGITGASAGAMNAVALAAGFAKDGRAGAKAGLRTFWEGVLGAARNNPWRQGPLAVMLSAWNLDVSPTYVMFDLMTRVASPYELNPLNINPLKDLVVDLIDFDLVRKSPVKVFISATDVQTGRAAVWGQNVLDADRVMASACLPWLFQAVEIDGVPYWDGGFTGNPPLWPLFEECESDDIILVQINPIHREGAPRTARDIINRINEITFNASLLRDLRAVDFVKRLIESGRLSETRYRDVRMHMIEDESTLSNLGASSKFNVEPDFINMLFEDGRRTADDWLKKNWAKVGECSTVNLRKMFQGEDDSLDGSELTPPMQKKPSVKKARPS
jgi:NTE family protein